MIVEQRSI